LLSVFQLFSPDLPSLISDSIAIAITSMSISISMEAFFFVIRHSLATP